MGLSTKVNQFVIANPKVCIGCATCMAACYDASYRRGKLAVARLVVTRTASGTMPNQCRQCDDAPCANVCPTGALRIGENSIELYEEICIGCKMCTLACPFGAIRAEAEIMPSVNYAMEPKYNLGLESESGAKSIAVKCDLCAGLEGGPTCVQVCPTGALMFVNGKDGQSKLINKKSEQAVSSFIDTVSKG